HGVHPLWLDAGLSGGNPAVAEVEIQHFLFHAGPLGDLHGCFHGVFLDPLLGFDGGCQDAFDHSRVLLGTALANDNAAARWNAGFAAVVDLASSAPEFHDL